MAVNKVIYGGNTLVDLTGDTVTAADLADGVKATGADGNPVIGLMQKVTIDAELSTTSTNPVQNKVIKAALDGKLGKNETAARATQDGAGNTISTTYASKADVSALLSTKLGVNSTAYAATRDGAGNTISTTYASKADVSALLSTKLGVTATAYAAARDGAGNNIVNTYAKKTDIPSAYTLPNATSSTLGGVKIGSNISVSDGTISITKSNVTSALGYTPPASDTTYGDATTTSSGLMSSTDKVKLNGIANNANYYIHPPTHPASMISGLATVATSGSYNDLTNKPTIPEQITVDSEISSTSTNPVQNKIVYEVLSAVRENLLTQINNLSAVAKSGSYNDLTDKPSNATTSSAGLMSAADKSKLDKVDADVGGVKLIIYS